MNWSGFFDWLERQRALLGEQATRWLIAAVVFVVLLAVLRIAVAVLRGRFQRRAERTAGDWDNAVAKVLTATRGWFLVVASAYFALFVPNVPDENWPIIRSAAIVVLLLQGALWTNALLQYRLERYVEQRLTTDPAAATTMLMISFVAKLVLWTIVLLLVLDNVGINVTALIAGLGIGGVAIALASQNILGDLFSALSIVLDKPFVLGDFIVVGDMMGSVEKIGLKTTRVRSLSGEQLILPNGDLLQSRIRNFKRMNERRIAFSIGVTYQTPVEKLEAIPRLIRETIESQADVRFDRSHFKQYGDSAFVFESVYFVLSSNYNQYMDTQQNINLQLYRLFKREGIEFAYPTQTIILEGPATGGQDQRRG